MRDLDGEVAVVTGGSRGIGLATARLLSRAGARVYLVARDPERLNAAAAELGEDVHGIPADLTDSAAVQALTDTLRAREERLHILVNCAGQLDVGPAARAGAASAQQLAEVNYLGAVRTIEACLPLLRAGPRRTVVNVCSVAGRMAPPRMASYAGSKFALYGYTLALREELRRDGFHVGLVFPGPVATELTAEHLGGPHYPVPPLVPVLTPDAVAEAILRLIRRRRREITVPRRLGPVVRLLMIWPGGTDLLYRWLFRDRQRASSTGRDRHSGAS